MTVAVCLTPLSANADTLGVTVNGNCAVGSCPPTSALANGTSKSRSFSFDITLPNLDIFAVVGTATSSINGNDAIFTESVHTVQYLGNQQNALAPSQTDQLQVDALFQFATTPATGTLTNAVHGFFSSGVASGSTVTEKLTVNGTQLLLGPFSTSPFSGSTNGPASLGASTLFTLEDDLMFAAGSTPGAFMALNPVRPHRRCRTSRSDLRERWSSRIVATAAESRLSI